MKAIDSSLLLLMNLAKAQSLLSRRFDNLSVHGIGFNDFMILYMLRQAPGEKMRRVDLADAIGLTSSGVTRMLVPMEKIGLVKREINERDARVSYVVLTEAGKTIFTDALKTATRMSQEILPTAKVKKQQSWLKYLARSVGTLHKLFPMSLLASIIPAKQLPAVERALLHTFQTKDVADIVLLTGGLSPSLVYKIIVAHQSYLLRIGSAGDIVSAQHIYDCMQIAAEAKIAPTVYYAADEICITGFVENENIRSGYASHTALIIALAGTIRRLHDTPVFPQLVNPRDNINSFIEQLNSCALLPEQSRIECERYYSEIKEHYPWNDDHQVSSHNDLNPGNILFDGKQIWFIDWDAAGANDRFVDLAIAAQYFVTSDDMEMFFLNAYLGDIPNDNQRARFFLMRQMCYLVYAAVFLKLAAAHKEIGVLVQIHSVADVHKLIASGQIMLSGYEGQLVYGSALFNEALNNMRSPRFNLAIVEVMKIGSSAIPSTDRLRSTHQYFRNR